MVTIVKIKQSIAEFVKFLRFGKNDVQTAPQCFPFGIDSKAVAGDNGVHTTTANRDESVILGYVYNFEETKEGEIRIYSKDNAFSMHFKDDGTVEFGGDSDNLVKYLELSNGLSAQDSSINAELTKIAMAISGLGGSYVPSTISTDISSSKIENIKV